MTTIEREIRDAVEPLIEREVQTLTEMARRLAAQHKVDPAHVKFSLRAELRMKIDGAVEWKQVSENK